MSLDKVLVRSGHILHGPLSAVYQFQSCQNFRIKKKHLSSNTPGNTHDIRKMTTVYSYAAQEKTKQRNYRIQCQIRIMHFTVAA